MMLKSKTFGRLRSALAKSLSVFAVCALLACQSTGAATDSDAIESHVNSLLQQMTFEEKVGLMSGTKDEMHIPAIERLKIPSLKFSDGPVGVRVWGKTTAYPCGAMLASTWDVVLAKQYGAALGRDSRARGVHVLLGPGVDLYRVAQCGRNFEYFGEDPYLSAKLGAAWIKGVQGQGVATSVKHYAANDQEILRDSIDTIVSERRLHEICFPPFKEAVQEANAWTVMAAYNKINGDWCTANKYLLSDVLRNQWGFKGILMSDWGAVHQLQKPITAGTDLEMGKCVYYTPDKIKLLMQDGKLTQEQLDEHVRRILRMSVAMGFLDRPQEDKSIPLNDPESAAVALKCAREGLVLLKNKGSLLPLSKNAVHNIVVMGPNACPTDVGGGGSSTTEPFECTSLLDAIRTVSGGSSVNVSYIHTTLPGRSEKSFNYGDNGFFEPRSEDHQRLVTTQYFNNADLSGTPVALKSDSQINVGWGEGHPTEQITSPSYSVRWTGKIKPEQHGKYLFFCMSDGARVLIDGKPIIDLWTKPAGSVQTAGEKILELERGVVHDIVIEYHHISGAGSVRFAWGKADSKFTEDETKQITQADAVVVAVGFNPWLESEGFDRPYDLPEDHVTLLNSVAKLNPHVVAVLNAGGNVGMEKWIDGAEALIHAWYPGQNGNVAISEAIFGELNPSGKLPDTFEAKWEDSPAFGNYPGESASGGKVNYAEGIYCGYRWFDKKQIAPRFPFGFGLSYTTFAMDNMRVVPENSKLSVSVDVKNTGSMEGAEVVQLYVRPVASAIDRPVQELKAFARIVLKPGEKQTVAMHLDQNSFGTYDETSHGWKYPPGRYEIAIGSSSRDIHEKKTISWEPGRLGDI